MKVGDFVKAVREVEAILLEEKAARLASLKAQLLDHEKALPAHSVRPHQLQRIEELEDQISVLEKEIAVCRIE